MTEQKQPEALRLAELLELAPEDGVEPQTAEDAAAELLRQHTRIAELEAKLESIGAGGVSGPPLYTHPSPPEGMVGGWMPIATAPVEGLILLAVEDSAGERRVFAAEASHENGGLVWNVILGWLGWMRLHSGWTPILWRRLPPPPTTSAGSGKGE